MNMAKKFPTTLYVKTVKDGSLEYFTADADADSLVDMAEHVAIARYQLVDVRAAKGVASFGPARKPRS
jgi:hypothetical protein